MNTPCTHEIHTDGTEGQEVCAECVADCGPDNVEPKARPYFLRVSVELDIPDCTPEIVQTALQALRDALQSVVDAPTNAVTGFYLR